MRGCFIQYNFMNIFYPWQHPLFNIYLRLAMLIERNLSFSRKFAEYLLTQRALPFYLAYLQESVPTWFCHSDSFLAYRKILWGRGCLFWFACTVLRAVWSLSLVGPSKPRCKAGNGLLQFSSISQELIYLFLKNCVSRQVKEEQSSGDH